MFPLNPLGLATAILASPLPEDTNETGPIPDICQLLDPSKLDSVPKVSHGDFKLGSEIVTNKGKGIVISQRVVVLRNQRAGQPVGYYTGFYYQGNPVAGIFFDKTGAPVGTLGAIGEHIDNHRSSAIRGYHDSGVIVGRFSVEEDHSFGATISTTQVPFSLDNRTGDSEFQFRKLRYIVAGKAITRAVMSEPFAALSIENFSVRDGYDPQTGDYAGAIAEVGDGRVVRLVGLIKKE